MIRDPQLRAAIRAAYLAWQKRQAQLTLDIEEEK